MERATMAPHQLPRLLRASPQPDDESPFGTHTCMVGPGAVGQLQSSRIMGLAPEATHPLQRLATMQGKVNHPRLLSGMWWLWKVTRVLLLCKHS